MFYGEHVPKEPLLPPPPPHAEHLVKRWYSPRIFRPLFIDLWGDLSFAPATIDPAMISPIQERVRVRVMIGF